MKEKLEELYKKFESQVALMKSQAEVLNLKAEYLGKKGALTETLKSLKKATVEEKKIIGPLANTIKDKVQKQVAQKLAEIEKKEINQKLEKSKIDISFRDSMKEKNHFQSLQNFVKKR